MALFWTVKMVTVSVCYSYFCHSNRKLLLYCTIIQGVNKSLNNFIFRWDAAQRLKKLLANDYSLAEQEKTSLAKATDEPDETEEDIFKKPKKVPKVALKRVPTPKSEAKKKLEVAKKSNATERAEATKKSVVSKNSEAPKNSEVSTTRTEVTKNSDATKKSETSKRSEADASKKSMDTKKPQATKKSEAPKRSSSAPKSTPKTTTTSAATLNKRNMKGETLLHRECIKGNVEKVRAVYHSLCPQLNNN